MFQHYGNRYFLKVYETDENGNPDICKPVILSFPKGAANKLAELLRNERKKNAGLPRSV